MTSVNLKGADLTGAQLDDALIGEVDFHEVKGVDANQLSRAVIDHTLTKFPDDLRAALEALRTPHPAQPASDEGQE